MRAIWAKTFSGYGGLRQTDFPKPQPAKARVLARVTAAGCTPLEHTALSGGHPRTKVPLVLGNEGTLIVSRVGRRAGLSLRRVGGARRHLIEDRPFGKTVLAG